MALLLSFFLYQEMGTEDGSGTILLMVFIRGEGEIAGKEGRRGIY